MSDDIVKNELYPSNSNKKKEEDVIIPEKKVKKVVSGKVTKKNKTLGDKFKETFVAEDADDVGGYIVKEVVIPTIKDTIVDIVTKGVNMIFYGDVRSTRAGSNKGDSRIDYGRYSSLNRGSSRERNLDSRSRASHDFDNLSFTSRAEAEEVRDSLVELIYIYGQATVADLYDLAGITSEYTDQNWGWTELGSAKTRRVRDGYIIVLPRAVVLE